MFCAFEEKRPAVFLLFALDLIAIDPHNTDFSFNKLLPRACK